MKKLTFNNKSIFLAFSRMHTKVIFSTIKYIKLIKLIIEMDLVCNKKFNNKTQINSKLKIPQINLKYYDYQAYIMGCIFYYFFFTFSLF